MKKVPMMQKDLYKCALAIVKLVSIADDEKILGFTKKDMTLLAYGSKNGGKIELSKLIKKHFSARYRYAIAALKVAKDKAEQRKKEADSNIDKTIE